MTGAVDETASAVAQVAAALVRASYTELEIELNGESLRAELTKMAGGWLREGVREPSGVRPSSITNTEDSCADQLLAALGLTRDDV